MAAMAAKVAATESACANDDISVGGLSGNPVNEGRPVKASATVPYPPRSA